MTAFTPSEKVFINATSFCLNESAGLESYSIETNRGRKISSKRLVVDLMPCVLPVGCRTPEQSKDLLLIVALVENGYDGLNYSDPIKTVKNVVNRFYAYEGVHKSVNLSIVQFESATDTGVIIEDNIIGRGFFADQALAFDYEADTLLTGGSKLTVNIQASSKIIQYKRRYGKLVDLLSNLGGIV